MSGRHTIVLVQFTQSKNTRTYIDFESVTAGMDGICQLYEQKLKQTNPQQRNFTYDIHDLFRYIDNLTDLSCLVYNPREQAYVPYNRDWIKNRVYEHLSKIAQK